MGRRRPPAHRHRPSRVLSPPRGGQSPRPQACNPNLGVRYGGWITVENGDRLESTRNSIRFLKGMEAKYFG